MEKTTKKLCLLLNLCILLGIVVMRRCNATTYFVGDTAGWDISSDLDSWPLGKTFSVGDVLIFQYSTSHSVYEVGKEKFKNCNTTEPIRTFTNGNTTVPLPKPGKRFFVCGNRLHCFAGMRLQVDVEGNGPSQAPTPTPTPTGSLGAPAGILQPSSKKNNPATGVTSSAAAHLSRSDWSSIFGIFVYVVTAFNAFSVIWSY